MDLRTTIKKILLGEEIKFEELYEGLGDLASDIGRGIAGFPTVHDLKKHLKNKIKPEHHSNYDFGKMKNYDDIISAHKSAKDKNHLI